MTPRPAMIAAFGGVATVVGLVAAAAVLTGLNGGDALNALIFGLGFAGFAFVGAVVVSRRPDNVLGWLFLVMGVVWSAGSLAEQYALYSYVTDPGALPLAVVAAWYGEWYWILNIVGLLCFVPLLFPTGHPLSRRWGILVRWLSIAIAGFVVYAALDPRLDLASADVSISSPIGLSAIGDLESGVVGGLFFATMVIGALAGAVCVILRFRRSRGQERQQMKWFTYAAVMTLAGFLLLGALDALGTRFDVGYLGIFLLMPVAAAIAILRYRLYDIDVIISRTLVYGVLTATLALVYVGLVAGIGTFAGESNLVVAGSTLAVAALFQPARNRIQAFIDRRFNRQRYDAVKTVEAFSARLRDEIDLDALSRELLVVVQGTMQPARISLWLRGIEGSG